MCGSARFSWVAVSRTMSWCGSTRKVTTDGPLGGVRGVGEGDDQARRRLGLDDSSDEVDRA